ncbi:hypothetical protein TNCV_3884201 [Trichonephila clavipes]|nr:hypothetical protein TNCV_3884201 [Trichonephila clavipes]
MICGDIQYEYRPIFVRIGGTLNNAHCIFGELGPVTLLFIRALRNPKFHQDNARPFTAGHEDSPRQDKIICSMQTLPRSSTDAQSHLECPTVATKLLKMGMVPLRDSLWELLYSPDAPRIAEAVIKTFDGI